MQWNYKKGIILTIVMIVVNIVLPYLLWEIFNWVLPADMMAYLEENINPILVMENGIVLTIMVGLFAFSEEHSLLKIILNAITYVLIIYLFFVGSAINSLFLPCNSFANIILETPFISIAFNYGILAILVLVIIGLYFIKQILEFFLNREEE